MKAAYILVALSLAHLLYGVLRLDFFDFDPTEGLDDDAVEATLDTNTFKDRKGVV